MDAMLTVFTIAIGLIVLLSLAATFGVDSRDGFADDRLGTHLR